MKIKLFLSIIFFIFIFSHTKAQDDFGIDDSPYLENYVFNFGSPLIEASSIANNFSISLGSNVGVIFYKKYLVGVYGFKLTSRFTKAYQTNDGDIENLNLSFGHLGFMFSYIFNPKKSFHWAAGTKLGWGQINLVDNGYGYYAKKFLSKDVYPITPQVEAEFNLSNWIKLNLGIGYRYVLKAKNKAYGASDFNSPVISITMLFGRFQYSEL